MSTLLHQITSATVPAPIAAGVGLLGLGAGLWWMRARMTDLRSAAIRTASAASTYWARAEASRNYIKAIESPTTAMPLVQLQAATATRRERLAGWAHDLAAHAQEAWRPTPAPRDWADGEMTAAFALAELAYEGEPTVEIVNTPPVALPQPVVAAPAPQAPPPVLQAPRGPQTPPRWVDGGTPPRRDRTIRVAARSRQWTGPLLGLKVPALELPALPAPFRMPTQRILRPTPALLAKLPDDPTRQYRTRTVAA